MDTEAICDSSVCPLSLAQVLVRTAAVSVYETNKSSCRCCGIWRKDTVACQELIDSLESYTEDVANLSKLTGLTEPHPTPFQGRKGKFYPSFF